MKKEDIISKLNSIYDELNRINHRNIELRKRIKGIKKLVWKLELLEKKV